MSGGEFFKKKGGVNHTKDTTPEIVTPQDSKELVWVILKPVAEIDNLSFALKVNSSLNIN